MYVPYNLIWYRLYFLEMTMAQSVHWQRLNKVLLNNNWSEEKAWYKQMLSLTFSSESTTIKYSKTQSVSFVLKSEKEKKMKKKKKCNIAF